MEAAEAILDSGICGRDSEFRVELHVECVQHIRHEHELLHISVVNALVVFICQLKTLFTGLQLHIRLHIVCIRLLDIVPEVFFGYASGLLRLSDFDCSLLHFVAGFVQ